MTLSGAVVGLGLFGLPAGAGGSTPDDPVFTQGLQWGLERIHAPAAWNHGTGQGVTIAVVDSGVDLAHEDLAAKLEGDISCIGAAGNPAACGGRGQDDNGHGTHVSGIALAATGNGRGIAGVAPDARLLAVRALANSCDPSDCSALGSTDDVVAGIRWAADHGADVINLSLGGGVLQSAFGCGFCDAVEYAWAKGAIPVVAAGNDIVLPAGFDDEHAVVVTATTRTDARAFYSNSSSGLLRDARWPIAAPGGESESEDSDCATGGTPQGVLSTYWVSGEHDEYACQAGTSMAAPHVSGALAVLLSQGRSPSDAVDRLLATAKDLGAPGRDDQFGAGLVDLARAVGTAPGNSTTSTTTRGGSGTTSPPGETTEAGVAAPFTSAPTAKDGDGTRSWLIAAAVASMLVVGLARAFALRRRSH